MPAESGKTIAMTNPASGEVLSTIQAGTAADVERAVDAAYRAFPSWSKSSPFERQAILLEMANVLKRRMSDYALMETLDNGKPISESMSFDLPMAIGAFDFFAGAAFSLSGESIDTEDSMCVVHREAIGVCAQIIPWNVPLIMMAGKLAPALAAGNTVVLKPAESACLSVLEFIREVAELLPPGVVNVVTGYGADVGEALVANNKVAKVAFTGSKPTAQKIMHYASTNIIPQTLELGGKSANIICADADVDAAAESVAISTIFNKGEVCLAGTRVLVQESIQEEFLEKLKLILDNVKIGDPRDPDTQLGAQASLAQYQKIQSYLDIGRDEGASVFLGGEVAAVAELPNGYFIKPTIFTGVNNKMRIAQEEIFGPVSCVIPWADEEEALAIANDSRYGLGGGLWTKDLARAHRMSRQMRTGTIWVNKYYNFIPGAPVGGYKESGYGRENCMEVLKHYTTTKSVVINLA